MKIEIFPEYVVYSLEIPTIFSDLSWIHSHGLALFGAKHTLVNNFKLKMILKQAKKYNSGWKKERKVVSQYMLSGSE